MSAHGEKLGPAELTPDMVDFEGMSFTEEGKLEILRLLRVVGPSPTLFEVLGLFKKEE